MTDKHIIIDGIDVSGCEFYWLEKDICNNGNLTSDCQEHKDCIYKRYIRKEQECEELKEKVKKYGKINEQETKDYAELKVENDELKDLNTRLDNQRETYWKGYQKLKQTLTEIKEIAERVKVYDPLAKQILQKISEVEDEN